MVKKRPVIIISEKDRNHRTCIVVPLGRTKPTNDSAPTTFLSKEKYAFLPSDSWAKCEVVNSVRHGRLYRLSDPNTGRSLDTRATVLHPEDLLSVRRGVGVAIGEA